jgi:predicted transcriptional regulator
VIIGDHSAERIPAAFSLLFLKASRYDSLVTRALEKIRLLRSTGMSISDIAKEIGVSEKRLVDVANGLADLRSKDAQKILDDLHVAAMRERIAHGKKNRNSKNRR